MEKVRVLITGANGQVGSACGERLSQNSIFEVVSLGRNELDISNRENVFLAVNSLSPDVIVNAAAMTNVDACEGAVSQAFAINSLGPRNLIQAAELNDAHVIHLSTDFVFDGKTERPYSEFDLANPMSVYGKSKLGGDNEVLPYSKGSVLRVAWVFGNNQGDFFKWVLDGVKNGSIKALIDDQVSTPTYSYDVAEVIEHFITNRMYGLYNVVNRNETSRLEMGKEICRLLKINEDLAPIAGDSLNRPAPRPAYSALSTDLLERTTDLKMRSWQEALADYIKKMD